MNKFTFETIVKVVKPIKIINKKYFRGPVRFSIDSRTITEKEGFIAIKGSLCDGHDFIRDAASCGVRVIVCEKEMLGDEITACIFIVKDSLRALEDICRFLRKNTMARVVAITGSVGKTTTKEMLSFILGTKGKVLNNDRTENNFLGVCKTLLRLDNQDFLVTELGTNSRGEIAKLASIVRPDVGVITFIKPAHIKGLPTLKDVFEEKIALLSSAQDITAVLNRDDLWLRKVKVNSSLYWFGKTRSSDIYAEPVTANEEESLFLINKQYRLRLNTPAHFFVYNAMAAILTAKIFGMDIGASVDIMREFFMFPRMRMERTIKRNVTFINDAYNSNPFSLKEGLGVVEGVSFLNKIAVIGDMLELGDRSAYFHRNAATNFLKCKFKYIFTFGSESKILKEKLVSLGYKNAVHFDSYKDLIPYVKKVIADRKYLVFVKGSRQMRLERIIEDF